MGMIGGVIVSLFIGFYWYKTTKLDYLNDVNSAVSVYQNSSLEYARSTIDNIIKLIDNDRKGLAKISSAALRKKKEQKLKNKWEKWLTLYRYGKSNHGYIFAIQLLNINGGSCFGVQIVNPIKPYLIGKCLDANKPDTRGFYFRKAYLRDLRKNGRSITSYYYKIPGSSKAGRKRSYIRLYKPWNWIIGTGIYDIDLSALIKARESELALRLHHITEIIAFVIIAIIIITISASILMLRYIKRTTENLFAELEEALKRAKFIDSDKYRSKEIKTLAGKFNKAIKQFKLYEDEFITSFVSIMETRDGYTKGHSQRVAYYAAKIAKGLGLGKAAAEKLYRAGLLHDIGKIGIPDNVLLKPGRLTANEYEIIKNHPLFSYEILKRLEHFKYLADLVRHHHEKCDGSGYPDGLVCSQIPLETRILTIADIFDALTTTRPYRGAFTPEKAIEILKGESVDQEIVSKTEKLLVKLFEKDKYTDESSLSKKMDDMRSKIFEVDYMTGLTTRSMFLKNVQKMINQNQRFVIVRINIKEISKINYHFSNRAGDTVITTVAKALLRLAKDNKKIINSQLISRFYADVFYLAHRLPAKDAEREKAAGDKGKKLLRKIFDEEFSKSDCFAMKDKNGKSLASYIDFHISYAIYPDDATDINTLIYITENKKSGYGKKE